MSSRTTTKRLLQEITNVQRELPTIDGVDRLAPASDGVVLSWEAVVNGKGVGGGYEDGRWLLSISVPENYPNKPPSVRFVTRIAHPNVNFQTGEICLDLLKDAWTPAYTILKTVEAIRQMLSYPEIDSPLNVDLAALMRGGDLLGARGLIGYWCEECRWNGE